MNLRYLGDALDHWKGALLSHLIHEGQLSRLAVYPMATDWPSWTSEDYSVYAGLLRVPVDCIIRESIELRRRGRAFSKLHEVGDVFLDPDTGIATSDVRRREQYVLPEDIFRFMFNGENRVVAVYQHIRAQRTRERVARILQSVPDTSWASYESSNVAMLFLSGAPWRTEAIANSLGRLLGRHSSARIFGSRS